MNIEEQFISITISFPKDMIKFLDEESVRKDMNRSQLVRSAVRKLQDEVAYEKPVKQPKKKGGK